MSQKNIFDVNPSVLRKPFLRWTGGKRWLIPEFSRLVSNITFKKYHEPFIGGGSVFFSLNTEKKAFLSDCNRDLINTYQKVKNEPLKVIRFLKKFPKNKEGYYSVRGEVFKSASERAAQFIYLNKTSFNGIYRVNSSGKYNVPYGNKSFESEPLFELILSCSSQLKNCTLCVQDFDLAIKSIKKDDLVYLDPPYTITHNNNGFVKYNEKLFSNIDQYRLVDFIKKVREKGAYYILSNACHPDVKNIYGRFNDKVLTLKRRSLISGSNSGRGLYKEFLFTNII